MFMWSPRKRKVTALSLEPSCCPSFLSGTSLASSSMCNLLPGILLSWCQRTSMAPITRRIAFAERVTLFYGLTPAGILSDYLSPVDKVFLWRSIVLPALTFGCGIICLRSVDIDSLECLQSRCIKAALGLSKHAHHSALLIALSIPRMHEEVRRAVLFGLSGVFRGGNHRLRGVMTSGLAVLATDPQQLSGTFLDLAYRLLNCSFQGVLEAGGGHVDPSAVRAPFALDGIVGTLRF